MTTEDKNASDDIDRIDLSEEEIEGLDPLLGISEDKDSPDDGYLLVTEVKVIRGKNARAGAISILVEAELHIDDRAEPLDGDVAGVNQWITISNPGKKPPDARQLRNNNSAMLLLKPHIDETLEDPDDHITKKTKPAKILDLWNNGNFRNVKPGLKIPCQITRWESGVNIHAIEPDDDE